MSILDRFFNGDKLALAKIISHIENRGDELSRLLPVLYPKSGDAYRIGMTGPPGAGKSTSWPSFMQAIRRKCKRILGSALSQSIRVRRLPAALCWATVSVCRI